MGNYSIEELKEFADGISMRLCSLRSAQHWKYDEETANRIIWLDGLYDKIKDDMEHKDCFQPKSNQQPLNEEVAKVFQFGMAFGFIESLNSNKNDIPLDELRAELEDYITHSPYIKTCTDCCRLRDDVLRIIDKYKKESEE